MKVSVIIPVYNQKPECLKEAIESVINQTVKPHEIIIVDDGSDNPPIEFALPDGGDIIKIITNEKNMGIGYSRQRGVEEATGDYIAFLSSDDIWMPNFLEVMEKTLENLMEPIFRPRKILYSNYYFIDEEGNIINKTNFPYYDNHEDFCIACWEAAERNTMFVNFSTIFIPREVFNKVQFDKTLRYCEDLDFLLRSMKHFEYFLVNKPLLKYRVEGNLTSKILDKIPKQNESIRKKCMEYWKCQK